VDAGYTIRRMVIIHSEGIRKEYAENVQLVTRSSDPSFFDGVCSDGWMVLDRMREIFEESTNHSIGE
jgi:hypothetical protein